MYLKLKFKISGNCPPGLHIRALPVFADPTSRCHAVKRLQDDTGFSLNIVFFTEFLKIFRTLFSLGVSVRTHTRQVENQRCSRTGRVQKNHNI